jgi:hypothetical protein
MVNSRISENISSIKQRMQDQRELQQAHHFVYDKRYNQESNTIKYILMGINPGETPNDWLTWPRQKGTPTEETSAFDFHEVSGSSRSAMRWKNTCKAILGTLDVALAEAFFWSSKDVAELESRYGKLERSEHLEFCTKLNRELIEIHAPDAVIVVGVGAKYTNILPSLYTLRHVRSVAGENGGRVIEHYEDGSRPWIFCKHWTGARPSNSEKETMRTYIANLAGSDERT